jgi:hypothetical protein
MNALLNLRKSLGRLAGKKKENCNGVLSLSDDLIESVLDVKQDTAANNISYKLEKDVLDDMLKDDEKKSPCDKIREEYIPNIISSRQINLDAYINFLKFVKKNYYEFNISVIKVIYSRLEIEENKKKYTYGDDFKELYVDYVDFNNTGNADKIKKKYKKDYEPLSRIYKQSIKIYDKFEEKKLKPGDIKNKCENDIEMFERKLKRLNYFLDSLKNIYNQLYSENYITTDKEGNPEIVNNERIKEKRKKIVNSEFEKRRKTIGDGVKYQINIQTGDIPHYYTFSEDLSITAKKNKQKAWDEFINNLGEEKKWLDNKEFGQLIAYKNRTISENYEQLLSKEGNKTEKALYYLVFKINELWNKKSDEDKQQFKIYIESQIKEKPNEEESVSSTVPTLKRVLLDTKDSLNNKEEKTESDEKILKLLTFLNIQSRNPNIQNILKDNVFNENSPKPYLYGGLGELKQLLKSEITSMNDIYDNVSNQEQEEKLENTGSKKKEKKEKDPRINQDLVINLQKELEKRGIIEAGTGLSEEQKEEFKKKEKKEKNQPQASKKWKFYTEYKESDFFETLKNNKYGTLRRKSRVILKKRKSSRRIKNRRSTLRKR